jgi:hypothetical protein
VADGPAFLPLANMLLFKLLQSILMILVDDFSANKEPEEARAEATVDAFKRLRTRGTAKQEALQLNDNGEGDGLGGGPGPVVEEENLN